ncbi:MAG: right-handed parallel beta-helix repeat-containing protein [Myxococcota bacterium]
MLLRRLSPVLAIALLLTAAASVSVAAIHHVKNGESIQAALDAASAGDTVIVDPGTYQEDPTSLYGLHVTKDDIRLIGRVKKNKGHEGKVILLANGDQETGIYAAPPGCDYTDSECPGEIKNFYVRGFTVEGFPRNGIQTRWVDGFRFIKNESVNNLNNGIYPTLSANGLVRANVSYGSLDTAMWVAGSENVRVVRNEVFGSPIGLEITVSNDVVVKHNEIHDNTVGVGLFHPNAAGNPPLPEMSNWIIAANAIYDNNLPNPAPPNTFQAGLPLGGGVLLLGVSDHVVRNNRIEGNDFYGVGMLGWCTALSFDPSRNCEVRPPIADPSANNNTIKRNIIKNNGTAPPAGHPLAPLASDVLYFQTPPFEPGTGNCFVNNEPANLTFFSSEPDGQLPTDGC